MAVTELKEDGSRLEAFRAGDNLALNYFFNKHHKALCYFAGKLIDDEQQGEDLVADCFLKLWQRHETFETAESIKAFLYISCRNLCLNYLRDLKRKTAAQESYLYHLEQNSEDVLYEIIDAEVIDMLAREIEELPEKCREVFKLIYFEGKKSDEIAEILGLNVQTVRNHKTRAIELLRAQFLKKGLSASLTLALMLRI